MAHRSPARFLAPLALLIVIAGGVKLVSDGLPRSHATPVTRSTPAPRRTVRPAPRPVAAPRFYIVRSGDTLAAIAARLHLEVSVIEALNPGISPSALHIGQRLRLTR